MINGALFESQNDEMVIVRDIELYSLTGDIIGNSKSHVYHQPEGCPSYDKVSSKNQITFESESAAQSAGYRKAGNCK